MKKLLQLFGILDMIAFVAIFNVLFNMEYLPILWIKIALPIFGLSFLVSGYLLIRIKLWGVYLNYLQIIPRMTIYAGMSFGFIFLISELLNLQIKQNNIIYVALVVFEVVRLVITIFIHFKYFRTNKASLQPQV